MKRHTGVPIAVLACYAFSIIADWAAVTVHGWYCSDSCRPDDVVLSVILLDFATGLAYLVPLGVCLTVAFALRYRHGVEGRWFGFIGLVWLSYPVVKASMVLLRTGWLWNPSAVGGVWRTPDEYTSDPGGYVALLLSIGLALLFWHTTRHWSCSQEQTGT